MNLGEIAKALGATLHGDGDTDITGVCGLEDASPTDLAFVSNRKYVSAARETRAGAIIVDNDFEHISKPTLRITNPYLAFARSIELFYTQPEPKREIDSTARIAESARIGNHAAIGPHVAIEDDVVIGDRATLAPFTFIGRGSRIGDNFRTHSNVSVREYTQIGHHVILQDGVRIGTDGFGYAKKDDNSWYKIVQSGFVVIEDDVEIGANSTVDRGTVGETRIKRGAKIDNLVQVGHASIVGEDTLLCAQVGLGGSSKIGKNCIFTGQVGVVGHLKVGDGVIATGQTGIPGDVEDGKTISGSPGFDNRMWLRSTAVFKRLPELLKRLEALEKGTGHSRSRS
jgi:UDP-3-O-[3-hydroxymyristoyl] glucosamine N-acyltransferase